jgi:4-amino-4-deoxy-L-arabinose transferase-like glycosyltransferase
MVLGFFPWRVVSYTTNGGAPEWRAEQQKRARVRRQIVLLILITAALRLAFAAATGLGVDESYMVATGRELSLGYFDHPPAAWWLSWAASHLTGSDAPVVVRLPFILLFALTTWLMARLGEAVGGPRAGFWAAVTMNLSPVFGVTSATWVLPDGPLDCALTGAALCLMRALPAKRWTAWGYWCGAGICGGLAMFAKYSAVLTIAGAFLFLILHQGPRRWLHHWHPFVAVLIALLIFSPVYIWNVDHHWASFDFQAARAGGWRFHPLAPLTTLGGEALFVLPWFWLPMVALGARGFRSGWRDQMLAWLAAPPIVIFALISVWSSQRVLFHWAAPGYLMLFPLLGRLVATHWERRGVGAAIVGTAAFCVVSVTAIGTQLQFDWLHAVMPANDPTAEGLDWTSLRDDLAARGLLHPGAVVGVPNWRDAGKIAYGLGPDVTVICLNEDSRQFGFADPAAEWTGADVLLLVVDHPGTTLAALSGMFRQIDPLPPSAVTLRGRTLHVVTVAIGRGFSGLITSP